MKVICYLCLISFLFSVSSFGQSKPYVTTGGEMIFSFANIDDNGTQPGSILRWAPVFNIQTMLNKDMSEHFGLFSGLAIRNVGYIYDGYTDPSSGNVFKKKFRSYNLSVPFGVKIGNLDRMFIYGGYELELPLFYKEKTFDGGDKIDKITGWFSNRQVLFQHGFLVGIQFPYGINLKFKYYLSEFHNQDFVAADNTRPYAGLQSNIFYFSLSSYLFRNFEMNND